jgi:hypothetical protein
MATTTEPHVTDAGYSLFLSIWIQRSLLILLSVCYPRHFDTFAEARAASLRLRGRVPFVGRQACSPWVQSPQTDGFSRETVCSLTGSRLTRHEPRRRRIYPLIPTIRLEIHCSPAGKLYTIVWKLIRSIRPVRVWLNSSSLGVNQTTWSDLN